MRQPTDIANKTFGRLTALRLVSSNKSGARWACLCECGTEIVARGNSLRSGHIKSCGCLRREGWDTTAVDLTGRVFGKLTCQSPCKNDAGRASWICACECGNTTVVRTGLLTSLNTKSCGCGQSPKGGKRPVISGLYAIYFASKIVKFGRSEDVLRRVISYKREAIFSGGAKLFLVACDDQKTAEYLLLRRAAEIYVPIMYESFRDIDEDDVKKMLGQFGGGEPQEIIGVF